MKNDEKLLKVPISFEKVKEYYNSETDERFTECIIKILHLGRNYNGSVFDKEVVLEALPSIANTPILGFIEKNKDSKEDFSDHRMDSEKDKEGNLKLKYKCSCYGVIPESSVSKAYFGKEISEDGIEREYLFVHGLLFNKFEDCIDILKDFKGIKSQSMELSDTYEGNWQDDGFHFTKFKFYGATILGEYVTPAMINSTIEVNFSASDSKNISKEIENKLNQFNKYFNKKEDDIVEDNKEKEQEKLKNEEENTTIKTPKENNSKEDFQKEDETIDGDDSEEKDTDKEGFECGDEKKKYSLNFSLSHEDIRNQLYEKLWNMETIENTCYGIIKTQDDYFIYCDFCEGKFYKQTYSKTKDEIQFVGERVEVFEVFIDETTRNQMESVSYSTLQAELEDANKSIETYSKENLELKEFKFSVDETNRKSEIDKVISRFSSIDKLDLENYRQKAYNGEFKSNEELENTLFSLVGKLNFSKIVETDIKDIEKSSVNYTVSLDKTDECPYKGLENLFSRD
ncbi:hypothetical protein [Clostridium sp. VAP52]|uniref:hypothetical protein n=1 Tax=Clostridium sp. VAP52 TaxID=2949977 RepID=UPI002079FD70|nr:hypothetical protein [Clostridium sp. VAP52]